MNVVRNILSDFAQFFNVRTGKGLARTLIALVLIAGAAVYFLRSDETLAEPVETIPTVVIGTIADVEDVSNFSLVGTVESKNQARIQTEAAGRVVRVRAELGDELGAGAIIAELENAAQYAALLQAEGAYEAALAAAAQSDVSVEDAQNGVTAAYNSAYSTYRSAYTSVNSTVVNTLDQFFTDTRSSIIGLRIDANGYNPLSLSQQQVGFLSTMQTWQNKTSDARNDGALIGELNEAAAVTSEVISLIDIFIELTANADQTDTLNGALVTSYTAGLTAERAALNNVLASIDSSITAIQSAEEALRKAQIGSTQDISLSAANAQVKQALGSLRAAEANYQKTIIRTPIAGTLNELSIKTGDFVTQFSPVALVANNNALEITTYVGERDAARIEIGQEVFIEGSIPGTVTAIAPGIDSETRKTEVKIAIESETIATGDTVTITFSETDEVDQTGPMLVPITAVKFTATAGSMFIVENNRLKPIPVVTGEIVGSRVTIIEGIDRNTAFVLDARGLTEGAEVEAVTK